MGNACERDVLSAVVGDVKLGNTRYDARSTRTKLQAGFLDHGWGLHTPSDASKQRARRGLSEVNIFAVCAALGVEKTAAERSYVGPPN